MINKIFLRSVILMMMLTVSVSFSPITVQAVDLSLPFGSLIKLEGAKEAAVYQIGSDGKKYVFPDQKTFETWHDDFSQVQAVSQSVLDSYSEGGLVTLRAGTRLITHKNTAKVYALGSNGQVTHIPNEATARKFYGDNWYSFVMDVDPGIFASSYRPSSDQLMEANLPEESLVVDNDGVHYLIENGLKRKVSSKAFEVNNLSKKKVIMLDDLSYYYDNGEEVTIREENFYKFDPSAVNEKILICHQPSTSTALGGITIKVSQRALAAHLAHGDTLGACPDDGDQDQEQDSVLPDIMAYDIGLSSDRPNVNEPLTITAYIKNSGKVALTSSTGILNLYKSFEDFETGMPSKIPNISEAHPFKPGDIVAIEWKGYFNSPGEKRLYIVTDNANELEESNEINNRYAEYVRVNGNDNDVSVDITVSDISFIPESPTVNDTTTLRVHVKNSGSVALTSTAGILNSYQTFQDFITLPNPGALPSRIPDVSVANPLEPGDEVYIEWTGYFSSIGNKKLFIKVDNANELEESNENNNRYAEYVIVND